MKALPYIFLMIYQTRKKPETRFCPFFKPENQFCKIYPKWKHYFQEDDKNPGPFPGGFLPPRTGWKWWRYHEMSDKEILDHLLNEEHYDNREKPPTTGK